MKPHNCPTCNGTGKVSRPPWVAGDQASWLSTTSAGPWPCQSCNGRGILWEQEDDESRPHDGMIEVDDE